MDIFPELQFPTISSLFDELYFNIGRRSDLQHFGLRFTMLLKEIKQNIEHEASHISRIKQLIISTRDIRHGKGERALFYTMLYLFYEEFPDEALILFYKIIPDHGSWRDIPGLCETIRRLTNSSFNPLIEKSIEYINKALYNDLIVNADGGKISTAAKWIPRETSKNRWLFDKLAEHWTQTYSPHIFKHIANGDANSQIRAISKSRLLYRKIFTKLSSKLDLIETKMCQGDWESIDPLKINRGTWSKSLNSLLGINFPNKIDRMVCKEHILSKSEKMDFNFDWDCGQYVKQALGVDCGDSFRIHLLNEAWNSFINKNSCPMGIPMVDISESVMFSDRINLAVGLGLWIASKNNGRILFMANQPYWKPVDQPDFISNIKSIFDNIPPPTRKNILGGFSLILRAILDAKIPPGEIEKMKFSVISDMKFSTDVYSEIKSLFITSGLQSEYKIPFPMPHILFFNISPDYVELPSSYDTKAITFIPL
jgi:hypothetical protein